MAAEGLLTRLRIAAGSVRARTTAGAVVVVGVALVVASFALVIVMQRTLENGVAAAARLRAHGVITLLEAGEAPGSVPIPNEEDVIVQVLDASGRVLASDRAMRGRPAVAQLVPGEMRIVDRVPIEEEPDAFLLVAEGARAASGDLTVVVGRNLDTVRESAAVVTNILLAAVPILLVIVGLTTWRVVGRALSPVEAIRTEVSEITAPELHRRVPIPPGDDEIARLARTMNDMLTRLDAGQRRQQRLVSDASHELRSPIAAIRQHAEVALSHPDSASVGELASDVLEEDERLARVAEDLLLLARADEHTLELEGRPLDLDDLVLAEARRLRQLSSLRVDIRGVSAARTRGDRRQLQRVVRNLADNAISHAESTIRLAVSEADGRVVLEVEDDGPGVPVDLRGAIFERFTRLDEARDRERGGAGLGLAIVTEIVAAHGGSVSVGDAAIGGARFEVLLPKLSS
jgi:signal transduction histidine kinase